MREQLNFFRANGYCVVPEALSADELAVLNAAIDRDREQYPQLWQHRGEGGRYQSAALLLSSRAFDAVIRHPAVFGLVEELMGGELCFEELSAMVRQPHVQDPPQAVWHRDTGHWPDHPLALRNLSLVYYLTAVDAASHCFAVVPETVAQSAVSSLRRTHSAQWNSTAKRGRRLYSMRVAATPGWSKRRSASAGRSISTTGTVGCHQ